MNVSLYQAAAAMNSSARWQEIIASNLASAANPGARRHEISFSAVQAGMAGLNGGNFVMPTATSSTNFEPAALRPTGANYDFGIEGKGFFEVQLPDGSKGYTRDGEFHLDAQRQLVTKQGYNVVGDSGPVRVDPANPAPLSISPTGQISQGADVKGRLHIVEFAKPEKLTALGQGIFTAENPEAKPSDPVESRIHQGFLEASNSSPTAEMASLVNAMRMFESNQHVIQIQDERMGHVISELGNPT